MTAMRVLVLHNRYRADQPSGENTVVDTEVEQLRAVGIDVVEHQRSSDEIANFSIAGRIALAGRPVYSLASVATVRKLIKEHRPDVVHLHNPYPLLSPAVLSAAKRLGVATVVTAHNYRLVCAKGTFFRDGRDCHDCDQSRVPLPAVVHACYRGSRPQSLILGAALVAHHKTWHGVDRFIALTPVMATFLVRSGIAADRIVVKPNTVPDPGPLSTTSRTGFLFAGRLSPEKGIRLLMAAWNLHPVGSLGILRIAGDGELREVVSAWAGGRDDVEYLGRRSHADVQRLLATSAVVVVPSAWDEICPMIAIEALSYGCPVLGTRKGGLPFLIGADAGWLVESDRDALSEGLRLARDEAASRIGPARARFDQALSPAVIVTRLIEVYEAARSNVHAA